MLSSGLPRALALLLGYLFCRKNGSKRLLGEGLGGFGP